MMLLDVSEWHHNLEHHLWLSINQVQGSSIRLLEPSIMILESKRAFIVQVSIMLIIINIFIVQATAARKRFCEYKSQILFQKLLFVHNFHIN